MALDTPTTQEISANIIAQLEAELNQSIPLLPKSFLRVLAKVLAGVFILLYKYAGFMFLQIFVRTATIDTTNINGVLLSPLLEWGRLIGVGDPASATQAELQIDITVTSQIGSLPSGTQLVGPGNGITYITIGVIALDAPVVSGTIRAGADQGGGNGAGAAGNLDAGENVSFVNPIANINRTAVVTAQTVTGADGESTDAYRQRVLDRFQKPLQGGALADYEAWAEEPAGILRAYPYTSDCPGQVDVYIEATVESSGSPDGIPTAAQLQEALDSINADPVTGIPNRVPANALANTFAITRRVFDVTVDGLSVSNEAQVQLDIIEQLTDYLLAKEPFIAGLSVNQNDRISANVIAGEVEDVVSLAQGTFLSADTFEGGSPVDLETLGIGVKAKLGVVTFT